MWLRTARWLGAVSLAAAAVCLGAGAGAATIADLTGRWSGWGSIQMSNGSTEQVKCIATYFANGPGLQQNLRCASQSYKIDAVAKLKVVNGVVSGDWEERTYAAAGSVAGRLNGANNSFNLSIQGPAFSAAMAVVTNDCKQTISITPQGFDISRISIGLSKC
jgi:hypothetical protein